MGILPKTGGAVLDTMFGVNIRRMRDVHLNAIRRAVNFVHDEDFVDTDVETLRARLSRLEESWKKFESEINELIKKISGEEQENEEQCLIHGETQYIEARAAMCARISSLEKKNTQETSRQVVRVQLADLAAPDKLPEFDGDDARWASFKDAFLIDVDQNPNLTDVQKLRRLLSAVKGSAEQALGTWSVRPENYQLAWKRLCKVYGDDYNAIRAHIRQLFALPFLQQPTLDNIRMMIDTLSTAKRQLQMLAGGGDISEYIMIYMMEDRLDDNTQERWNYYRQAQTRPTLDGFIEFLEKKANTFLRSEVDVRKSRVASIKQDPGRNRAGTVRASSSGSRETASAAATVRKRLICRLCRGDHMLYRCPEFSSMTLERRKDYIVKNNMCENCFKYGHTDAACFSAGCPRCSGNPKHNSRLCPLAERENPSRRNIFLCGSNGTGQEDAGVLNQRAILPQRKRTNVMNNQICYILFLPFCVPV